jgi:hypothetical protein
MADRKNQATKVESSSQGAASEIPVQTLRCPNCAAAVPPSEEENTTCLRCGTLLAVPAEYRALRAAERSADAGREEAERLFRRLGRPPGILLRIWGKVVPVLIFFLWPVALTIEALYLVRWLDKLGVYFHANLNEVLKPSEFWMLLGGVLYVTLAVPLIIGIYGNRRTKARRTIQAALAARPSEREGGPSRCRACGAELNIEPGALGETCDYCEADNLVAIPESWISEARGRAKSLGKSIEEAAAEDSRMRIRTRRSMAAQLAFLFLLIPLLYFIGKTDDNNRSRLPPNWKSAIAENVRVVPIYPNLAPSHLRPKGCAPPDCYYKSTFIALRYNETARTVNLGRFPQEVEGLLIEHTASVDPIFGDNWQEVGESQLLMPRDRRTVEFRAPRSGWYKIDVFCTFPSEEQCKTVLQNTNHFVVEALQ